MASPCGYTWIAGVGWVPDPTNGLACPEEEVCGEPSFNGTQTGQHEPGPCLPTGGPDPPDPGGPLGRAGKRKRGR